MAKDKVTEGNNSTTNMVAGLDINDIVKRAQALYGKNEKGVSKQISTGTTINRPNKDTDFILWTGSAVWEKLTGLRGLPFGKIVQISGKTDSGKSTTCAQFMKYAQDQEVIVILWDSEQKFSRNRFCSQMQGNSDQLLVIDTTDIISGTRALAYLIKTIKDQNIASKILVCVDSIGCLNNSTESDSDEENMSKQPGVQAREIGYCLKKLNRLINQYQDKDTGDHTIAVLCCNQTYASIGMGVSTQIEKGGATLQYLSSLIVQLTRKKDLTKIKNGEKIKFGIVSRMKSKKNHLFDGKDCVAELEIVVSADGISLADEVKKKASDVEGWDNKEENDEE